MIEYHIPQPPNTRIPTSEDDWGDNLTRGLHLKRRGITLSHMLFNRDFGVYLGENKVGVKAMDYTVTSVIEYDTPEEMHSNWLLD